MIGLAISRCEVKFTWTHYQNKGLLHSFPILDNVLTLLEHLASALDSSRIPSSPLATQACARSCTAPNDDLIATYFELIAFWAQSIRVDPASDINNRPTQYFHTVVQRVQYLQSSDQLLIAWLGTPRYCRQRSRLLRIFIDWRQLPSLKFVEG